MKITLETVLAAALLVPLGASPSAAPPQGADDFLEAFEKARKAKDEAAMQELVRENQDAAVRAVAATCEAISRGTNEELERRIDALGKSWKAVFDTRFVQRMYEYFSLLRPDLKRVRGEIMEGYRKTLAEYEAAVAEGRHTALPAAGLEFEGYALGLEELGDLYYASNAWILHAWCFEERYLGNDADLESSLLGFRNGIRLRKALGLEDSRMREAQERLEKLEAAGVDDPETEFEGSLAGKAKREAEATRALTVALEFEPVEEIDEYGRPYYALDENYQMWPGIGLGEEGSTGTIPYVQDSPEVLRTGASEAMIDQDGDGKGDVEIPLTGTFELIELRLGQGDAVRPWAFLATIGESRDRYQGFDINLEPDLSQMTIYVAPAASVVGTIAGKSVRIFDDNMDGIYGSGAQFRMNPGTVAGGFGQGDFDSILVEGEDRARPWSRFLLLDDVWYELEMTGPMELLATPRDAVPTGTLELDFGGPSLDYLIVGGSGTAEGAYFDLAPGEKRGTTVPAGRYYLQTGKVSKGKREQVQKAVVVPPERQEGWSVEEGEETTVSLGKPFGLAFEVRQDATSVTVVGNTVLVTGTGGESYQCLWNCVLEPEVAIREKGKRKSSAEEEMRIAAHQDDIGAAGSFDVAWFPYDLTLEKDDEGEPYEVQLTQKRHDLFGKLESEWRE